MKLYTEPQIHCHHYFIPYNKSTAHSWEFYGRTDYNKNGVPILREETHWIDCKGNETALPNPVHAQAGGLSPVVYQIHLKDFDVDQMENGYIRWCLYFDDGGELCMYSDWFANMKCTIPVGTILPCLDLNKNEDINGDFVGTLPSFTYTNVNRLGIGTYSPQLYLRHGQFFRENYEYELKKTAKRLMKVTKKDVWALDSEDIGSNYVDVANSVLGNGTIYDKVSGKQFSLDELSLPIKDKKARHQYHVINAKYNETKAVVKGCDTNCYIAI